MSTDTRNGTSVEKVGEHAIAMTREFDAPVALVFKAMHDPDLVAQWMGPESLTVTEVTSGDAHGDTWTLVHADADGNEYAFRGVVHGESSVENGSSRTFEWLGMPGHVSFEKLSFEDLGGRTRVSGVSLFLSEQDRDGMFDSMGDGGWARLDPLLASLS